MTQEDINNKNLVLIEYLNSIVDNYKFKAEFSTNDNDINVITVQEETGSKVVFYGNISPLYNYYNIDIFGQNIKEQKEISVFLGNLIGKHVLFNFNNQKWQLIFMQMSNPKPIEYMDIRRVSYNLTLKCIVNRVG